MDFVTRTQDLSAVKRLLATFPVTAILGPRQCGKTTLARAFKADHSFDLEDPRDVARLEQPQLALEDLTGLIVIDEIQHLPDPFPLMRYLIDPEARQRYLILGSASRDLVQHGSEFLERDIPQLGITIPARTLRRFWTMLSHYHAQILNFSEPGRSFGV